MKKILVIEDDLQLQQIYKNKLESVGYTIIQATDGEEGLRLAQSKKPDLIILDIMLPGGPDGLTILGNIKKNNELKNIPVIVATNIEDQALKAIDLGAIWYFVKAHTPIEKVLEKIKSLLK